MPDVTCAECGIQNWLESQSRCFECGAVLRRCVDCANYSRQYEMCQVTRVEVAREEAERPRLLSASTNCPRYRPR